MADVIEITDFSAPELDVYARLTGAQLHACPQGGLFIAEGVTVIGHALDAGYRIASLLMEKRHITGKAAGLIASCGDVPVYTADSRTLEQLTGFALTRGVLAAFYRPELPTLAQVCVGARRVAVLEGLNDPTNVGAVMRSAAALGMDAVLLTPSCCDPLHRRAVRVSMGTVFQVPWTRIGQQAQDWPEAGMTLLGRTVSWTETNDEGRTLTCAVELQERGAFPRYVKAVYRLATDEGEPDGEERLFDAAGEL